MAECCGAANVSAQDIEAAASAWHKSLSDPAMPVAPTAGKGPVLPKPGQRNILITSALPYVNNVPHLGNIVGCVLSADVFARYCRLRGYNTLYICGTDEHGTATEAKALAEGVTPKQICDKYHAIHSDVYKWFDISFDHFGRTTTANMTKCAQDVFLKLHEKGFVSEDTVEQLNCGKCDKFLADRFVEGQCPMCKYDDARGDQCDACGKLINAVELINPRCKTCSASPTIKTSKHLFMDLPKLEKRLTDWLAEESKTWTNNARVIANSWVKGGLQPRCITRDLKWGTRVPLKGYENKVFYVWFEAPIGYMSITADYTDQWEKWWKDPENVDYWEFMAKDNVPFHSVVFPATLLGTEDENLKWTKVNHLMSTEYLNYEDAKFSKSRGIGVFGNDAETTGIPADIWRFYLIYTRPENADSAFKWDDLALKNNSELLANLGNFVNRALKFCKTQFGGKISPAISEAFGKSEADKLFLAQVNDSLKVYIDSMEKTKQRDSISAVLSVCKLGNQLMQAETPWKKVKSADEAEKARAAAVVGVCVNLSALVAVLVEPVMPAFSRTILNQLNVTLSQVSRLSASSANNPPCFTCVLKPGHVIGDPEPLVREIKPEEVEAFRSQFAGPQAQRGSSQPPKEVNAAKLIPLLDDAVKAQSQVVTTMKGQDKKAAADLLAYLTKELAALKK